MELTSTERMIAMLLEKVDRLTAERDEARREILIWVKDRCSWVELSKEIERRGWQYLKEKADGTPD